MSENLAEGTNGDATVMPPPNPRTYMFDAPEQIAVVEWGDDHILELTYSKPEDDDHLAYETAVQRKVKVSDGEATEETDPEPANVEYFDKLAQSCVKKRRGSDEVVKKYEREQCIRFAAELKTRFVVAMGQSNFEVVRDEDDEDAGMYEAGSGDVKVRQTFDDGRHDDIIYTLEPMDRGERKDFQGAWKPSEKAVSRKAAMRTTKGSGVKKGMKYFPRKIKNIEGGLIGAGPFSESTKADYVSQVDKAFQMLVIDAEVAASGKAPK